jgi:hypothetical protein
MRVKEPDTSVQEVARVVVRVERNLFRYPSN